MEPKDCKYVSKAEVCFYHWPTFSDSEKFVIALNKGVKSGKENHSKSSAGPLKRLHVKATARRDETSCGKRGLKFRL